MADKYGSILHPYYMGPTTSNNVNDVIPTHVFLGRLQGPLNICFVILLTSNSSRSMKMPKKKLPNNSTYILAEQVWSLTHTYLFVITFLLYFTPSDINGCENILCLNNGTCTDRSNGFNCNCPLGFSGNRNQCEISYPIMIS